MHIRSYLVGVSMLIVTGCGAGQNLVQNGQTAITYPDAPIRFMRETPLIHPRECPISMLMDVKYLETQEWPWYRADKWFSDEKPSQFFKACPEKNMDPQSAVKLATWHPIALEWSPSPFRVATPGVIQGAGMIGAAATLGLTMPGTTVNQSATAFPGAKISTFNSAVQYVPIQ